MVVGGGGGGEFLAAAASRGSGSAKAGLQWGLAALGTCVVFYVAGGIHAFPDHALALGLALLLVGAGAAFPIAGYLCGEVRPALLYLAIAFALAAAAVALVVGVAPMWGRPDLSTTLARAVLPVLVVPALAISAASPPGSQEGWRLAHATAALAAFALILAVQQYEQRAVKHVMGAALGALLLGPLAVATLRGLLRAVGVTKPPTRRDLGPHARDLREEATGPEKRGVDS